MGLEEHGAAQLRLNGQHRGVEALQVAGLQNALALGGSRNQIVGLGKRGGQRLFYEQVKARIEQSRGNRMMMHGRDGDGGCVEMKVCGQQRVHSREDGDCVVSSSLGGAGRVRFNGGNEGDGQSRRVRARCFQLAVDAQVIFAEGSGPGNGNAQRGLAHDCGIQPCGARTGSSGALPD